MSDIHRRINTRSAQALLEELMAKCELVGYEKAEAEIAALRAHVDRLCSDIELITGAAKAADAEIAALRKRVGEAEADAQRYRWLRDPNNMRARELFCYYGDVDPNELDAAIDAARKGETHG